MADRKAEIRARLLATFQVEAREHLEAIKANLLDLDRGLTPDRCREVVGATFREAHTLKGAARSVGLTDVERLCQGLESLLGGLAREGIAPLQPEVDLLHEAVNEIARLLAGVEAPTPAPHPPTPISQPPSPSLLAGTIRLATARLDALVLKGENLLASKLAAGERTHEARDVLGALARCRAILKRGMGGVEAALKEVEAQAQECFGDLLRDQRMITGAVDDLLEEMRLIRMMPASAVLALFPAMVGDLARERGKEVEWVERGAGLEVDRKVLDAMKDPLIHLVRNAIDHGIESPAARAEAGKALRGRVAVTIASLEGGRIEISVEDDGAGIAPDRVRAAAVRARLLTDEAAQALTDDAALDLVYRSGVSTSPVITDLSGHGLGLAIARERVERLGGRIWIETRVGTGTRVRMNLPTTIATFNGVLVSAGGQPFLLSTEAVERVIRIADVPGQHTDHSLSVARLSRLLGLPTIPQTPVPRLLCPCIVVRSGEERAGLLVEEVLGNREVVVKEFRPPLVRVRNVAGAGLLGTGQVVLILRAADLLRSIREAPSPPGLPAAPEEEGPPICVRRGE